MSVFFEEPLFCGSKGTLERPQSMFLGPPQRDTRKKYQPKSPQDLVRQLHPLGTTGSSTDWTSAPKQSFENPKLKEPCLCKMFKAKLCKPIVFLCLRARQLLHPRLWGPVRRSAQQPGSVRKQREIEAEVGDMGKERAKVVKGNSWALF